MAIPFLSLITGAYTAELGTAIASSAEYLPLFSGSSQLVLRKIWHTRIQMGRTLTYPSALAGLLPSLLAQLITLLALSHRSDFCSQLHLSLYTGATQDSRRYYVSESGSTSLL